MRLDIDYRKKSVKNANTWRLNNTLLNNRSLKIQRGNKKKIPRNK